MLNTFRLIALLVLAWTLPCAAAPAAVAPAAAGAGGACPSTLQYTFPRLQDEKPQPLCQYAGKVLLVVNTASYCSFTPQYEGLEALYAKYKDRGLVVLGFPSNDFQQETDDNKKIADFCQNTYGVKFPMFGKTAVRGKDANPFYRELARTTGRAPMWNFHKYLVARDGHVVANYTSLTGPQDAALLKQIEQQLNAP
jgi:glutathione peroxidase